MHGRPGRIGSDAVGDGADEDGGTRVSGGITEPTAGVFAVGELTVVGGTGGAVVAGAALEAGRSDAAGRGVEDGA